MLFTYCYLKKDCSSHNYFIIKFGARIEMQTTIIRIDRKWEKPRILKK